MDTALSEYHKCEPVGKFGIIRNKFGKRSATFFTLHCRMKQAFAQVPLSKTAMWDATEIVRRNCRTNTYTNHNASCKTALHKKTPGVLTWRLDNESQQTIQFELNHFQIRLLLCLARGIADTLR